MDQGQMRKALATALLVWTTCGTVLAADPVQIKVNEKGLQSLKYQGVEYCDPRGAGEVGFTGSGTSLHAVRSDATGFATTPTSVSVTGNTVSGERGCSAEVNAEPGSRLMCGTGWWLCPKGR
ncbi:MAG: hypothetical protein ABSE73_13855 [Planctomycetota bacterium]